MSSFILNHSYTAGIDLLARGGASPESGVKRDKINGQKVYLTIFKMFLLRNKHRPEKGRVDQGRAYPTEDDGPTFVQKPVVHEKKFHHLCPKNWSF